MHHSRIEILETKVIDKQKRLEAEEILAVAGCGVRSEKDVDWSAFFVLLLVVFKAIV